MNMYLVALHSAAVNEHISELPYIVLLLMNMYLVALHSAAVNEHVSSYLT